MPSELFVLDYDTVELLRRNHPAWRLLSADHASLIVSFLHRTFVAPNVRTLGCRATFNDLSMMAVTSESGRRR